jgi:molybdenum cofactor cytidylyltransferase
LAGALEIYLRSRKIAGALEVNPEVTAEKFAGIILSAGASRRMGSPKALLDYRGETFVDRLIRVFSRSCDPVIVVAGVHADAIRERIDRRARLVINPDPDRGQLSSLQTALAEVPREAAGFLFTPVDCPTVQAETIAMLVFEFHERGRFHKGDEFHKGGAHESGVSFVIPRYRGKRGHPVCARGSLIPEFLALPPTAETRAVVNAHADRIVYVDVDDPGVLADIDDLEAYRKIAR